MTLHSLSKHILSVTIPFSKLFSSCIWPTVRSFLFGAILCRGKRTVTAILRSIGLSQEKGFSKYHRILNRLNWSPRKGAAILFKMLLKFLGEERPVLLIDETLERRKGKKIGAKGFYRDAVRSSQSQLVKTSGLKWLVMALSVRFKFAKRAFALPFFSVLQPSKKSSKTQRKRHKTTMDWAIQMVKQIVRWVPNTPFILIGDGGFACVKLAWTCLKMKIDLVSRLKMNARLYASPSPRIPGKRGRKSTKGARLCSFKQMLENEDLPWQEAEISGYSCRKKKIRFLTDTCLWGTDGITPVSIRWVLIVDPEGKLDPLPLMCTDVDLSAIRIIELYIDRWGLEVTFEEVREFLGVETQRQWSEKAITRTTPILMTLYSMVCLIGHHMHEIKPLKSDSTAWYQKETLTFSDLLKAVRESLWRDNLFLRKANDRSSGKNDLQEEEMWMDWVIEKLSGLA